MGEPRIYRHKKESDLPSLDAEIGGRRAWEQQVDEPSKSFQAFQIYRDQGPRRTFEEVGRQVELLRAEQVRKKIEDRYRIMNKPIPKHLNREDFLRVRNNSKGESRPGQAVRRSIRGWSRRFQWQQRALAYDRHMDGQRLIATETEIREMVQRHIGIAGLLQSKAAQRLKEMDKQELTPKMVLDYLLEGAKLERLSREMATETVKVSGDKENPLGVAVSSESLRDELAKRIEQISSRRKNTAGLGSDDAGESNDGPGMVQRVMREMGLKVDVPADLN